MYRFVSLSHFSRSHSPFHALACVFLCLCVCILWGLDPFHGWVTSLPTEDTLREIFEIEALIVA